MKHYIIYILSVLFLLLYFIDSSNCQFGGATDTFNYNSRGGSSSRTIDRDYNIRNDTYEKYYVDPKGINIDGCGLDINNPCGSISYVILNLIKPNITSILFLADGVYTGNFSLVVTNYIVLFQGSGIDTTIIDLGSRQRLFVCTISELHFTELSIINGFGNPISGLYDGGAIYAYDSQIHFNKVSLRSNTCITSGGGIFLYNSYLLVENSTFKNNTSTTGGAIILILSECNITSSTFINNKVSFEGKGGAIEIFISFVNIRLSTFAYNVAPYSGAIDMVGGNLTAYETNFIENRSNIGGALGLYFISKVHFYSCQFISNFANNTGGLAFLTSQSLLRFSTCIIKNNVAPNCAIVESHSISPLGFDSCTFVGNVPTSVQIALYDNYCFLRIYNCYFENVEGVLIYADSISNIVIIDSFFTNVSSRVIDVGNEADILIISTKFFEIYINEVIISLSNGNLIVYDVIFESNIVLSLIRSSAGGEVTVILGQFFNNTVSTGLISLLNGYSTYIQNTIVKENIGLFKGCFIDADHSGIEVIMESEFINNTSPFGPILYFSNPQLDIPTTHESNFTNIIFVNNTADFAGALVYFSQNVSLPNISCTNCVYINNTARYGELVNSAFYSFNVSIPRVIYPFQDLTITIYALDFFGNLVRGTSDLGFFAIPCSDAYVEGNLFSVLGENGTAVFINIKLSSKPSTVCNVTFLSVPILPESGSLVIPIHFSTCNQDRELVLIKSIYYCLKTIKVSNFVKYLVGVLALILALILIFSGIISIKYRKKRVIRYSNPLFLLIILVGCIIFLVTIPVLFSTSHASCKLRFPLIIIGSCLITSAVFIKQFRIWRLIKDIQLLRETNVENKYLLKFISILMVIPIIMTICSFFLFPTHEKYSFNEKDVTITHYCSDGDYLVYVILFLVYQMAILLFGCYLVIVCRKFRSIPGTFNEATYIGILIYNYTVVLIVAIPLAYVFHKNPLANFLIFSISILVFVLSTIVLLYIPKFHFLLRKKAIISSLEKLIKEQEAIVQRNKDILYFYDMYLAEEDPNHQIDTNSNYHPSTLRRRSNINHLNMTGFSDTSSDNLSTISSKLSNDIFSSSDDSTSSDSSSSSTSSTPSPPLHPNNGGLSSISSSIGSTSDPDFDKNTHKYFREKFINNNNNKKKKYNNKNNNNLNKNINNNRINNRNNSRRDSTISSSSYQSTDSLDSPNKYTPNTFRQKVLDRIYNPKKPRKPESGDQINNGIGITNNQDSLEKDKNSSGGSNKRSINSSSGSSSSNISRSSSIGSSRNNNIENQNEQIVGDDFSDNSDSLSQGSLSSNEYKEKVIDRIFNIKNKTNSTTTATTSTSKNSMSSSNDSSISNSELSNIGSTSDPSFNTSLKSNNSTSNHSQKNLNNTINNNNYRPNNSPIINTPDSLDSSNAYTPNTYKEKVIERIFKINNPNGSEDQQRRENEKSIENQDSFESSSSSDSSDSLDSSSKYTPNTYREKVIERIYKINNPNGSEDQTKSQQQQYQVTNNETFSTSSSSDSLSQGSLSSNEYKEKIIDRIFHIDNSNNNNNNNSNNNNTINNNNNDNNNNNNNNNKNNSTNTKKNNRKKNSGNNIQLSPMVLSSNSPTITPTNQNNNNDSNNANNNNSNNNINDK